MFCLACSRRSCVLCLIVLPRLQHAREEEIAERKAMKRAERDIARKKEFVRRVRLQIEDKRAEVLLHRTCCSLYIHMSAWINECSLCIHRAELKASTLYPVRTEINIEGKQILACAFIFHAEGDSIVQHDRFRG